MRIVPPHQATSISEFNQFVERSNGPEEIGLPRQVLSLSRSTCSARQWFATGDSLPSNLTATAARFELGNAILGALVEKLVCTSYKQPARKTSQTGGGRRMPAGRTWRTGLPSRFARWVYPDPVRLPRARWIGRRARVFATRAKSNAKAFRAREIHFCEFSLGSVWWRGQVWLSLRLTQAPRYLFMYSSNACSRRSLSERRDQGPRRMHGEAESN